MNAHEPALSFTTPNVSLVAHGMNVVAFPFKLDKLHDKKCERLLLYSTLPYTWPWHDVATLELSAKHTVPYTFLLALGTLTYATPFENI